MTSASTDAEPRVSQDEELRVPKGSYSAVLMARAVTVAMRVAPRALARLSARRRGGSLPPFTGSLRAIEVMGDVPDPSPDAQPDELLRMFPELASIEVREVEIPGPHGPVPGRVYLPEGPAVTGLVWVHGGGWVTGTLDGAESNWVGLALARRGVAVLTLEYRKAIRGTSFPVPLDDIEAGWLWAAAHARDILGVSPGALHLGGASAGGNLVGGLGKKLRDTPAAPVPRTLLLAYPILHSNLSVYPIGKLESLRKASPHALYTTDDLLHAIRNYAGRRSVLADPYAFAANGPLGGQPPVFVLTAEFDTLRFSGQAYAAAVAKAGGDVTIEMEPGAPHGALSHPSGEFGPRSLDRLARWLLSHA